MFCIGSPYVRIIGVVVNFFWRMGRNFYYVLSPYPSVGGGGGGTKEKKEFSVFFSETFYPVINCITSTLSLALRKRLALLYN